MHRQLLPHQSDAVNSIMNAINNQDINSMVISMAVGTGSAIVALEVFRQLHCNDKNRRTLFLLDYVQLCDQLRDNLLKESGDDVFRKQAIKIMTYQQFSETIDEKALSIFDYIICFEPSRTQPAAYPPLHIASGFFLCGGHGARRVRRDAGSFLVLPVFMHSSKECVMLPSSPERMMTNEATE